MIWILAIIPVALATAAVVWLRLCVSKLRRTELASVELAVGELESLFRVRLDHLPEIISVCRVFTDYERGTLSRLQELHASLQKTPPVAEKIVLENAVSEFLRNLVQTIGAHPELEANVFLQQHLDKVYRAEEHIADRRPRVNQRVDAFNDAISNGVLAKFGKSFGLAPLRRLDMTAQELLKATSPFASSGSHSAIEETAAPSESSTAKSAAAVEDDTFDLSEDVDEFGGDLEEAPPIQASAAPAPVDDGDMRLVEVEDDDDGFLD